MIDIRDICFAYEQEEVLHNINLTVERGSFSVIVGPNGGGKTTLLRLILGLLQPKYGTITIEGKTPQEARSLLAYVPQQMQHDMLLPVSVEETVLMGRLGRHWPEWYTAEDHAKTEEALARVELTDLKKRPFSALSGGQRQRVLIAQALASGARLLLLDEPGASLDPERRLQLYQILERLKDSGDLTILLVSHNLNLVAAHATHVICVNRTADAHPISDLSTHTLTNGVWTQLTHRDCPVSDQERAAEKSPHHACEHHH